MKELLEQKYAIHIQKEECKYYVYNYFGKIIFVLNTLGEVEENLREYFKEKNNEN